MPDDDLDPKDAGLYFALFTEIGILGQLGRALMDAHLPDGLIQPHFTVLNHLSRVGDGRTPQQMARAFQVPKANMSHTLAGLEKRGLVDIRPNPRDGRSKTVWLTDAGRDLRQRTIAALAPQIADVARGVPRDRIEALLPVLTELRRALDAARDGNGPKPPD